jgi:hypothetical protein
MLQLTQDSRHLMQGILTSGSTWEIWIKNPSTHQVHHPLETQMLW